MGANWDWIFMFLGSRSRTRFNHFNRFWLTKKVSPPGGFSPNRGDSVLINPSQPSYPTALLQSHRKLGHPHTAENNQNMVLFVFTTTRPPTGGSPDLDHTVGKHKALTVSPISCRFFRANLFNNQAIKCNLSNSKHQAHE